MGYNNYIQNNNTYKEKKIEPIIAEDETIANYQSEILFVGALYANPNNFLKYQKYMNSNYDFSDECCKFFYDCFEIYYETFSTEISETSVNLFMSQEPERFRTYKRFHGYKQIVDFINMTNESDIDNYFQTIKKFALLREFDRKGLPSRAMLKYKSFSLLSADDAYQLMRKRVDKIYTKINLGKEAVNISDDNAETLNKYLLRPIQGIAYPWEMYNSYFLGMRLGKVFFEGLVSNAGKSRKLMLLAATTALIRKEPFLYMSNEMDEEDLRSCLITTVINNEEFRKYHGVWNDKEHNEPFHKPEREIVLGIYHDDNGEEIVRQDGEKEEEYIGRITQCTEYKKVKTIVDWIDQNSGKLLFKDMSADYSIEAIETELRKVKVINNVEYYGFDTLKGYQTDDWSALKQMATRIKEITNELHMYGHAVFQLTDDTIYTDPFSLSSMNISTSKGIKHVADMLTLGKVIPPDDYHKYKCKLLKSKDDGWGTEQSLKYEPGYQYIAVKIDKNRAGSKDEIILFRVNLNYNTWENIGSLVKNKMGK
ncbi:MAG: hypothetical protein PUH11_07985 [Bacilli bacterium]|nr:hypothetical protein [Bacilli bacterium]